MPGIIPQETRGLGVGERRRLTGLLRAQVPSGLDKAGGEPNAYPRCGGTYLAYEGHDRDGSQGRSRRRTLSRKAMGPLGYPESEEDVWATYVGRACAGGTLRECARACGVCRGTSWLVRTGPSEAVGRTLAPSGRGQPSPARWTARTSTSRWPAGGPGRRRCCPGSRGARRGRARRTRGSRASWRASGRSRRGGSATTSTGSCGTSRRGGRAPTGRTPCRARR